MFLWQQSFVIEFSWDGHTVVQPIANLYAIRTKKSDLNGHVLTSMMISTMLSGVTKQLFNCMETHRRHCYRKLGEKPRPKPRAKHPTKVRIWAGISLKGATQVCIFEGIMNAPLYCEILQQTLIPFIQEHFPPPATHCFMQDNDPKHTSRAAQQFFIDSNINWWKTPAESPDVNPIENIWHELKEYIRREINPTTKEGLIDGINNFWSTVDIHKCRRYIHHLKKVLPRVIELNGNATGY